MTGHEQRAAALREAADLIEAHPTLPAPSVFFYSHSSDVDVDWMLTIVKGDVDQRAEASHIVRALDGKWDKVDHGDTLHFQQRRGSLKLDVHVDRDQVCERVVVATEEVEIPAQPETVLPAVEAHTEIREIVEWRCDSLLRPADDTEAVAS